MRQMTLPPEMLPKSTDGSAVVVICRNPRACSEQHKDGCPFCLRVTADEADHAIAQVGRPQ